MNVHVYCHAVSTVTHLEMDLLCNSLNYSKLCFILNSRCNTFEHTWNCRCAFGCRRRPILSSRCVRNCYTWKRRNHIIACPICNYVYCPIPGVTPNGSSVRRHDSDSRQRHGSVPDMHPLRCGRICARRTHTESMQAWMTAHIRQDAGEMVP